jgi:hypothetical protein
MPQATPVLTATSSDGRAELNYFGNNTGGSPDNNQNMGMASAATAQHFGPMNSSSLATSFFREM